ncbi:hypothetical protein C8Q80DRAFT_1273509 [Daedaleopsis nitida]|nr:hypothetical protein C8Q80DRAFT_1273509 [Daedaleopsis nitida]
MSDISSVPSDTSSTTDPTSTNPTDSNATNSNPTDPNANDPNLTNPQTQNGSDTDPNAGSTTTGNGGNPTNSNTNTSPTDPNAGVDSGNVGGVDPNTGAATVAGAGTASFLPSATVSGLEPSAVPSTISGSDRANNGLGFDSHSGDYRKAIIIASALSGAVGLILVAVVIWVVYRRRNKSRRKNNTNLVAIAMPRPNPSTADRPASDATWIGTRIARPEDSFNESKLEAFGRQSRAGSVDSDATLADLNAARMKAFGTPSHSPRPSLDKLKIVNMPLVPEDPFEAPRLSMGDNAPIHP